MLMKDKLNDLWRISNRFCGAITVNLGNLAFPVDVHTSWKIRAMESLNTECALSLMIWKTDQALLFVAVRNVSDILLLNMYPISNICAGYLCPKTLNDIFTF